MKPRRIVILSDSPLVAESLYSRVQARFPRTLCVHVVAAAAAAELLTDSVTDRFVMQLELIESDGLDFLRQIRGIRPRTLVVSGVLAPRVVLSLRALGVESVHDIRRDPLNRLAAAVDAFAAGQRYWSESFARVLHGSEARCLQHQLTPREQIALALMSTGHGEKYLADQLNVSVPSVRSLRRNVHAKLELHDRQDVQRVGARLGFSRFGADGIRPFGMSLLVEEYRKYLPQAAELSDELLQACGLSPKDDDASAGGTAHGNIIPHKSSRGHPVAMHLRRPVMPAHRAS